MTDEKLMAKLNDEKVKAIRDIRLYYGMSQRKIAKMFNVEQSTIARILLYKAWRHV